MHKHARVEVIAKLQQQGAAVFDLKKRTKEMTSIS